MIQLQFLNFILKTKDSSLITLNNLNKDYFSDYPNEFEFISNHLKQYGLVPDLTTFLNIFPNFEILEVNEPSSYLVSELFKDYQTRNLAATFNKVRALLLENKVDEAVTLYKNTYENLSAGVALNTVDLTKDLSRYNDYVDKVSNLSKYYISTGFKELDELIGGWDRFEELAIIAGRTNQGKSFLLLKMAIAAVEQGLTVGYYSGEMTERKVGYRFDTLYGHISNGALMHGNVAVQNIYKKYIDSLPYQKLGAFKVLTPKMIGGLASVNTLQAFIEKESLDILFIDQHSLLEDDHHAKNPVEKAANISKDLKSLQVLKQIPIIAASQLNRTTTEDKTMDMSQIAQADRIGQDCTCAIFIERDKKDDSVLKLHLVKSRDSVNNKCLNYKADFNMGNFLYLPDESSATAESTLKYEERYSSSPASTDDEVF